jgi:hypothetical protein
MAASEGPTVNPDFRGPLFSYRHGSTSTTGCAIVGGGFYNPSTVQFPASYVGKYFFADLCTGWIRVLDPSNNTAEDFASGVSNPVDLKVAVDGGLYYLSRGLGAIFRVQFSEGVAPSITAHPSNETVTAGQSATFTVSASGSAPLSYQWQRNMANISGATSASYTLSSTTLTDNGAKFRCVVTNGFGNATSNEATLTVQPPPPTLVTEENTDIAIALDSVNMLRDPFPLTNTFNFSPDSRTRVMLFALNLDLLPNEDKTAVTAQAEDALLNAYPLSIEFVGKVPGYVWLTEVVVALPDNLPSGQEVKVSITWHARTSNKARFKIR